jgi:hypothetical protein
MNKRRNSQKFELPARPFERIRAATLLGSASPVAIALLASLVGAGVAHGQAVNLGGANNIVADGLTQTQIEVTGNHTIITTQTVSNNTGFNSFSDFEQAAGTRVDLYVPDNAGNLLNIVRNGRVVINGVLNGYKDGQIGGNIYFSDSHGFVVGAEGVVNVGSLTVNTPTAAFLEGVIGADGTINDLAAAQLMSGNVPLSSDGVIAIAGTVNARGAITLQGHEVSLTGGSVTLDGAAIGQRDLLASTVNSAGIVEGGALVSSGGSISIVATGEARIGGRIDASAPTSGKGGKISVRAKTIEIDGAARLTADGKVQGGGGTIEVVAADRLIVEDNSYFSAHGAGTGMGGFVELSGRTALIGSAELDLGSDHGAAGTLLLDPWDLYIGGVPSDSGVSDDYSNAPNLVTNGGNVLLQADNSITVSTGGKIDTTSATGNAGIIRLESRLITIADGATLDAQATGIHAAGDIFLIASDEGTVLSPTAESGITIGSVGGSGPTISGRNVTFTATSEVGSGLALVDVPSADASIAINGGTIDATGAFTATATASIESSIGFLPVGVVVTDVNAAVTVGGNARITADSADLSALASVVSEIQTMSLAPPGTPVDGALAVSTVDSTAVVSVAGDAELEVAGAVNLTAENDISLVANATPATAALGISIAVGVIDATTSATIGGNASVSSASLALSATTAASTEILAAASEDGGGAPQQSSVAKSILDDDRYKAGTETSDGGVSAVGGFAISDITTTTLASIDSTGSVVVDDALTVAASTENTASVTADGTTGEAATGVGVAVGINLAHVSNDAMISSAVTAGSLDLSATMGGDGNVFTTEATSGAGASDVGIAGSLATNLIDTQSTARIVSGTVTITGGGDVSLSADNATESSASALPAEGGATGDTLGIGASVATSIVANRALAEIADGAGLDGAGAVTLAASGTFSTTTEAEAGSAGGISLTPALGLSLVNNTTTARLGTGATLEAGSVDLSAIQIASTETSASGDAAGGKAAIGAALALAIVNDQVSATTARNIDVTGDAAFTSMGASSSILTAHASATGGEPAEEDGEAGEGGTVDDKVDTQLEGAQTKQTESGIGDSSQQAKTGADVDNKDQRSASTSEGKVSVAAAVGVNVQTASSSALIPDAVAITAGGTLTLRSAANGTGEITADGDAVGEGEPSQVGIGAAVAVNKVAISNVAQLGVATHTLGGLSITADKLDIAAFADDDTSTTTLADSYLASATSGAGGSKVGIAGSLALNLIDTESTARISGGAVVNMTDSGAISLNADNQMDAKGEALPVEAGTSGGKLGVGVSAAINIIANRSTAEFGDGVVISHDANAPDITLSASGTYATEATAEAGSAGGISLTPALGLSMISNATTARLGTGATLEAGSIEISATQEAETTTGASAAAEGGTAAVGVALALAMVNDDVSATTARSISASGDVTFSAAGKSTSTLSAEASATGAAPAEDDGEPAADDKSVDSKVDDQYSSANTRQTASGVGSGAQQSKTGADTDNSSARSAKTSEGKVAVAAAVSVNVASSNVTAVIPDSVAITAGGHLTVASANTMGADLSADGSAVGTGGQQVQVGIGAAVSVNVADKTNTASLGNNSYTADGVTVAATQFGDPADPDVDSYSVSATSGAGGSKVGIAGSLALNIVNLDTSASIAGGATIDAGAGASEITADQQAEATASAKPSGNGASGGKVGIGASVALNLITENTTAQLADGAVFLNGGGLAVSATSALDTTTEAEAGAAGGIAIDAVVAMAMLDQTVSARIGTGRGLDQTGDVSIAATSGGTHVATAKGETKSGNVGVGAAVAVIIGDGAQDGDLNNTSITSATLARDITAAALSISAESERVYQADATATAGGGKDTTSTATSGGSTTSTATLDKTKNSQQGTTGGKVAIAAAAGVAAAQDVVSATLGDVTVSVSGAVDIAATNSVDMATSGSGAASKSQVGIGVGVALGIINNTTSATIADGASIVSSGSVAVSASTAENTGTAFSDRVTALAVAGASSQKVSIAGAVAVGISKSSATASIGDGVVVTSDGDVAVNVDNTSRLSAKSLAGAYTSGNAGVGASVATVYSDHDLTAAIGAGTSIEGDNVAVTALNHEYTGAPLSIDWEDLGAVKDAVVNGAIFGAGNYYTEAFGGAMSTSGVAVQGSFAVMVFSDDVTASVGQSLSDPLNTDATTISAGGAVEIAAASDFDAKAISGGVGVGQSAGVGISSSVISSEGSTRALLAQSASVASSTSFAATADATQDIKVVAVSAAGGNSAGVAGVATAIDFANTVEALLAVSSGVTSSGDVTLRATNDFSTFSLAGGAAAGGTAGVGASVSVVLVDNVTRAAVAGGTSSADAVIIDAGGVFSVTAESQEDDLTIAAGGAGGGTVGAGAGVAVGVIKHVTTAEIGDYAEVTAGDLEVSATGSVSAITAAVGLGVGGTAGLAGAASTYDVSDTTTARIGANASVLSDGNAAVLADDTVDIAFISGAVSGSGTAAVGAAISVAIVSTVTHAVIDEAASVTALGNGDTVTYTTGYTPALAGSTGDFAAQTPDDYADDASSSSSEVLTAQQAREQGLGLLGLGRSATASTATARGVIVNATGETSVQSLAAGAAIAGVGAVTISANVPIITSDIAASIGEDARINVDDNSGASANQSVIVAAAGDIYRIGLAGALAGGTVGVGGGVDTAIVTPTVTASIGDGATVNAERDVLVSARGRADLVGAAAAAGGGVTVGIAGGVAVFSLESETSATIGDAEVTADNNVIVVAEDITRTASIAGSLAIGATGGGVGASAGVTLITKRTDASIADGATVTARGSAADTAIYDGSDFSTTRNARGVIVLANSNESVFTLNVAGGGGLFAGVAGAVSVQLLDVATTASIGDAAVTASNSGSGSPDVVVIARDSSSVAAIDGGLAIGAGAIAGAVDVGILKNTTSASIADGASITAEGRVDVAGLQNISTDSIVVSAAGGIVGIAAGVSVYSIGDGIAPDSEGNDQITKDGDVGGFVQGQLGNGTADSVLLSSSDSRVTAMGGKVQTARGSLEVADALTQSASVPAGTSASVGSATITAGGAISIRSNDAIDTSSVAGALGVGAVGFGAGVSVVTVDTTNTAQLSGSSTVTGGSLQVTAASSHTYGATSAAGALALAAAAQAALTLVTDNSQTHAYLGGNTIVSSGTVSVTASSERTAEVDSDGVSLALTAAAGVSYAAVNFGGAVSAELDGATIGSAGARAGAVDVSASSTDKATASTVAASGGLGGALVGSLAETDLGVDVSVSASAATIYSSGAVSLSAQSGGTATSTADGYAVAGILAAGGSIAKADVDETVTADISGNSSIDAQSVALSAAVNPAGGALSASASATGSSGALIGITATEATSENTSSANALAQGSTLQATGDIAVTSLVNTRQYADASGFAGGLVAAGFNSSSASSNTQSTARIVDMASVSGGGVQLDADGSDSNVADATSGSGGLVAGAAADAVTSGTSLVRAAIDTTTSGAQYQVAAIGGEISVTADHDAYFGGTVNSTQASVVGASGSTLTHSVNSTVDAHLGDYAKLRSRDLAISASNDIVNYFAGENAGNSAGFNPDNAGWNVDSGSGGLLNLPAGGISVSLLQNTTATIGDNADVHLLAPGTGVSSLTVEAHNTALSHQKAKLDSGGAIALADVDIDIASVANATVSVGELSEVIVDLGDIAMAAWSEADLAGRAAATTYGLAGAPSGTSYASFVTTNAANIGKNVRLEASRGIEPTDGITAPTHGTVSISAGTGLDGTVAAIDLHTTVDLYNKTAIPIDTTPDARSTVVSNASVLVDVDDLTYPTAPATYGVNAAGDITIRANRGAIDATAMGTGKDIYLEALSEAASAVSNLFGGGDISFDHHGGSTSVSGRGLVTIDGLVDTGIRRHQTLTINYDHDCTVGACVVTTGNMDYTITGPNPVGTDILERMTELKALSSQYSQDPVAHAAYQSEIHFLEKKLVALGLGTFDSNGVFVPGAYAGPSPKDAALALVAETQGSITTVTNDLSEDTGGLVVPTTVQIGDLFDGSYTNATYGIDANATTAKTSISQMSKHADLYANNSAYKTTYDSIATLISAGKAAAAQVDSVTAANATLQTEVDGLTGVLATKQTAYANALINNQISVAATLATEIATTKSSISTKLNQIKTNNSTISTQSALASSKSTELQTALNSLISQARDTGNSGDNTRYTALVASDATDPTKNGAITNIGNAIGDAISGLSANNTSLQSYVSTSTTTINALTAATSGAGTVGGTNSLDQYVLLLSSLANELSVNTNNAATASSASGVPQAYAVDVADTLARLGNISINADALVGTGGIAAPGDAKVIVTNNTANTLRLGNLIIPSDDAGRVRFNGVIVTGNDSINAINAGGASADFASVITAASSSRGEVSITSNYNGESIAYYNPASSEAYLNTPHLAPDIILKSGKLIDNLNGAVNITSAAGNIYVQGVINAGSVNILAKNGDFVSSYVNGFNHIGGDPASFNSPTRAAEAGKGITANGAVNISARYLNINSTIQSGIADWVLNLDNAPLLTTTDAASVGKASAVTTALATYQQQVTAAIAANGGAPSTRIDLGDGFVLNMGPLGLTEAEAPALTTAINSYLANPTGSPLATLTIGGVSQQINLKDYLSPQVTGRVEFSIATAETYLANNGSAEGVYGVISPSSNIGVSYDGKNKQYVVDGTSVRGGYIQLFGQIMNTASSGGQLNVLDGFGTINITNSGNIPVVLQTLSAGDDPTGDGRGTKGMIDIMDVTGVDVSTPGSPIVSAKHTIYTRDYDPTSNASGSVQIATQLGTLDNVTGNFVAGGGVVNTTGTDRTATYDPTSGQRYVWTTGVYYDNTTNLSVNQTQLFGSSSLTISETTHFDGVDGPHTLNTYRLRDGTYVTTDVTQTGNDGVLQTNQGIVLVSAPSTVSNSSVTGTELIDSTYAYMNQQTGPNETGRHRDCNWWTLCIASDVTIYYTLNQKYTVVTTNSLKADNAIAINFIGSDTGLVSVKSEGDVVLTNNVSAANGDVTICAGSATCGTSSGSASIISGNLAAQITGTNITLAADGSVGGVTWDDAPSNMVAPVDPAIGVNLKGGVFNGSAANGVVSVASRGDLTIGAVTAAGSVLDGKGAVNLVSAGSITGIDSSAHIQAPRVSLTALNGTIGSTATGQQLLVNTGFSTDPSLRRFGDPAIDNTLDPNPYLGLSATAGGDIGIRSTSWSGNDDGTMLVDKVLSIGGNVRLSATGFILDNNPVETIDSRTWDQLLSYWDTLGLREGTDENAAKQALQIAAFENSQTQAYEQYWQIRRMQGDAGATYDPNFVYALDETSTRYQALLNAFGGDPGKVADYEQEQTELYHQLNATMGGLTSGYVENYRYEASGDQIAYLTDGAEWTNRELAFSLSPGALKTVTATNPVIKDANVSGRSITLEAGKGIGETIGAGTATPGVQIAGNLAPSALTIEQKVALAAAERTDIVLNITYQGSVVDVPAWIAFDDLSPTQQAALLAAADTANFNDADITITILSKRPLNFNASTSVNVDVAADPTTTPSDDLGKAYLASRTDALLGQITVKGETRIKTIGSIRNAASSSVSTGNLILEAAQGSIGSSGTALNLTLPTGSTFTARALNGVFVNLTGDALIDTVYSPGEINLAATGSLLNANGDKLINILGSTVTLSAATGTIGSASSALNVGNGLGGSITASAAGLVHLHGTADNQFVIKSVSSTGGSVAIESGGRVLGVADASIPAHITATSVGATVSIVAALGIGDQTPANAALGTPASNDPNPLRILNGDITLSAANGDIYAGLLSDPVTVSAIADDGSIYLTAAGDFHGTLLEALKGTVSVAAEGDITIDALRALNVIFDAGGKLALHGLEVAEEAEFHADELDVSIKQVPAGPNPFKLVITGPKGTVGTVAHVVVDAPFGLVIPELKFIDSDIETTARTVQILEAYVPGSFTLDTPLTRLVFDNRSPAPQQAGNAQMYAPDYAFTLDLKDRHTTTDAWIVKYDASAQVTQLIDGERYDGMSLVRDTVRVMYRDEQTNQPLYVIVNLGGSNEDEVAPPPGTKFVVIDGVAYPVVMPSDERPVQLSQLFGQ